MSEVGGSSRAEAGLTEGGIKRGGEQLKKDREDVRRAQRSMPRTERTSRAGALRGAGGGERSTTRPLSLASAADTSLTLCLRSRPLSGACQSVASTCYCLLTGRTLLPGWAPPGRARTCCILCACCSLALFWKPLEHAESGLGSLGAQTGAKALAFLPPARAVSKCLSDRDGKELNVTAAEISLGQKSLARR